MIFLLSIYFTSFLDVVSLDFRKGLICSGIRCLLLVSTNRSIHFGSQVSTPQSGFCYHRPFCAAKKFLLFPVTHIVRLSLNVCNTFQIYLVHVTS